MIVCKFEDGGEGKLRHITVGAIVANDKQEVLLIRRAVKLNFGKYAIPGGFLDRNETTEEAARRELKEETGYEGEISSLFRINDSPNRPKEDRQNVDFLYIAKVTGGELTKNEEVSEIGWFSEESLPSEDEFAFDHRESVLKYFQYLKNSFKLPLIR